MGKVNTIFSYFSKTPKKTTENQVLSPKTPTNSGSNLQAASNNTTPTSSKKTNEKNGEITPGKTGMNELTCFIFALVKIV